MCGSHSFHTANTPNLPLPVAFHQRAPLLCVNSSHLITAYYSFIDPERMKGWVGLVWWPTAGGLVFVHGYPSAAGPVQASESSPVRDRRSTTELHTANYCIIIIIIIIIIESCIVKIIAVSTKYKSVSDRQYLPHRIAATMPIRLLWLLSFCSYWVSLTITLWRLVIFRRPI